MTSLSMYYPPLLVSPGARLLLPFPALRRHSAPSLLSSAPAPPSPWMRRRKRIFTIAAGAMEEEEEEDLFTVEYPESGDDDDDGSLSSPWEGALVYRRDAAVQHLEYATTLERLGLGDLSSPDSRARAAAMGILSSTKADRSETPVLVSVDVTRRRGRLRLDGIVRTVITLGCFRSFSSSPLLIHQSFYSSLLSIHQPISPS